jgi:hypothetical protein
MSTLGQWIGKMLFFKRKPKRKKVTPPSRMRAVGIKQFRKFLICESKAVYRATAPDPKGVRHVLPPTPDPAELGAAIRDCLQASRFYLEYPDVKQIITDNFSHSFEAYDHELMQMAGVKTVGALYRGSKCVNVDDRDDRLTFTAFPLRRGRHFWCTEQDPCFELHLPLTASDEEIGQAFYLAREHCSD